MQSVAISQTPSSRFAYAKDISASIPCSIGQALTLLSGGTYQGAKLDEYEHLIGSGYSCNDARDHGYQERANF